MGRVLATSTRVRDDSGVDVVVGPGECPGWAVGLVVNPAAWVDDGADEPEPEPAPVAEPDPEPAPAADPDPEPAPDPYAAMTVAELKAEIASRNEGRDPVNYLPAAGTKTDLIVTLTGDDNK